MWKGDRDQFRDECNLQKDAEEDQGQAKAGRQAGRGGGNPRDLKRIHVDMSQWD